MSGFPCPFCGMIMAISNSTHSTQYPSFGKANSVTYSPINGPNLDSSSLAVEFYRCPNCGEHTIMATGRGNAVKDVSVLLRPVSMAKKYPAYIPKQIREDYEEACAILHLSPKASATLARRCLQGMIRDFWNISKGSLYDEISALKGELQPDLWVAIDSLRKLGNIGAHMESDTSIIVDIDPDEAEKLVRLIELLMKEWYINREDRSKLLDDIFKVNEEKQAQRKGEG